MHIDDPAIDFAAMARSMGCHGEGPITDPKDLGPALIRAIAAVKAGQPAVVDVVPSEKAMGKRAPPRLGMKSSP